GGAASVRSSTAPDLLDEPVDNEHVHGDDRECPDRERVGRGDLCDCIDERRDDADDRGPGGVLHHGPAGEHLDHADDQEEPTPGVQVREQDVVRHDLRVGECGDAVDDVEEADEEQQDSGQVEPGVAVDFAAKVGRRHITALCLRPEGAHQFTPAFSAPASDAFTPIAIRSAGCTHASARWKPPASRIASRSPIAQRWSRSAIAAAVPGGIASSTYHMSLASKTWPP